MFNFKMKFRFAAAFLLAVAIITGCKEQRQSEPAEKITIAYSQNAILIYIAFTKGFFAEENLDAVPKPYLFGKLGLQALIEGKADVATVGDTPIVLAVLNGKKITTLAMTQTSNKNEAIVARSDRGITGPSDLRGKKIGLTKGTTGDFFAYSFLLSHGIDRKNVKIIDLKPDEMAAALTSGKVDAVSTWNPNSIILKKLLGSNGVIFFGEPLYTEIYCVVAGQEYVRTNPGTIEKLLRALIKAETFVKQHPEEAHRIVDQFLKRDNFAPDEMWESIFSLRVMLDQALLLDFEEQSRWAIKEHLTESREVPDFLNFIYINGLQSVKPEAVRIIR